MFQQVKDRIWRKEALSDFCIFCLTEAVSLDDWYLKTKQAHGKTAIIECICPWCVNDLLTNFGKESEV